MKRGSSLKTYARLERRTPLRARKISKAEGRGGRLKIDRPSMTPVRESAPARRRGTTAVVEAVESASPSTLAFPKPVKRAKAAPALRRRKPMKRRRPRRIDRETPEETAYKRWIHEPWQSCDLAVSVPGHKCGGVGGLQAAHLRDMTGFGLKENWLETIPACPDGHDEIDGRAPSEFFGRMTLDKNKAWMRGRIAVHNARFHAGVEVFG